MLLQFDGASRGNPGRAGAGFVLYDKNRDEVDAGRAYVGDAATNNEAEYVALIRGLEMARERGDPSASLQVQGDSLLVIQQMRRAWKVKAARLRPLHAAARRLAAARPGAIVYEHIPRRRNARADALANEALDA